MTRTLVSGRYEAGTAGTKLLVGGEKFLVWLLMGNRSLIRYSRYPENQERGCPCGDRPGFRPPCPSAGISELAGDEAGSPGLARPGWPPKALCPKCWSRRAAGSACHGITQVALEPAPLHSLEPHVTVSVALASSPLPPKGSACSWALGASAGAGTLAFCPVRTPRHLAHSELGSQREGILLFILPVTSKRPFLIPEERARVGLTPSSRWAGRAFRGSSWRSPTHAPTLGPPSCL